MSQKRHPTRFTVRIDTVNAAFDGEDAAADEVARILRALAARLEEDGFQLTSTLRDISGNTVGIARWSAR